MRIEAYTQIQQIYGTKNKARTQNTAKSANSDRQGYSDCEKRSCRR